MNKKNKVCVYAICKNEEKFVDEWIDSMSEADLIVVTDTGSTDGTVEKLRKRGAIVHVDIVKPWRFDVARNISLNHIPNDIDICVCTDLDERFETGWRKHLEKAWGKRTSSVKNAKTGKYLYNWSLKPDGSPDVQFNYFKIHSRFGFRWKCPIHEFIEYIGIAPLETIYIDGMVLNHYPDDAKSRNSYLPLLEMAVLENPSDDRMAYYLAREYTFVERWDDCIEMSKKYLSMPSAVWDEERCAAMRLIAESYYKLGDVGEASSWYFRAIAEVPNMREPYIEFAQMLYYVEDWSMSFYLIHEALKIKTKSPTFINTGYSWDQTPYDLGAIACYNIHHYKQALTYARQALEYSPNDERLATNCRNIEEALNKSSY